MIRKLASYSFDAAGTGVSLLKSGWAAPGDDGVWALGAASVVELPPVDAAGPLALEISLDPQEQHAVTRHRRIAVSVNHVALSERRLGGAGVWRIPLPSGTANHPLRLRFALRDRAKAKARAVRLTAINVVRLGHAPLPPAANPLTEFLFSWNEPTEPWLGDGFGTPEDAYVWAIGGASVLRLPVPPDGSPRLALLDMRPFHKSNEAPRQRVVVWVDDGAPVTFDLRDRLTVAIDLRPHPGQASVTLSFRNLDAAFSSTDPLYHFGKPFAWALASARIVPALPRYLPTLRPRLPGTLADGSLQASVQALTFMPAAELARGFEGLGNGCELGQLQIALGHDRLGLLRFSAIRQRELVEGIFRGFHGVARAETMKWDVRREEDDTWRLVENGFGVSAATPYTRDADPPADGLSVLGRRLPRLADKLMEDIAAGEFIFVLRISEPMGEPAALAVLAALRHFGPAEMIWLVTDGTQPPGTVERLACGLIRGHLETPQDGPVSPDTMLSALANAYVLLRQAQPLPP